jgi:hypothetical protein
MSEKIRCPFCNYETPYPIHGKVSECLGECYTTYSIFNENEDANRARMKLVETFFLDSEYNLRVTPEEIEEKCEFSRVPAAEPGMYILFAREKRIDEVEIEKLKNAGEVEAELGVDTLERVHSALERFERDLKDNDTPREKLLNEIKVVEKLIRGVRERLELSL